MHHWIWQHPDWPTFRWDEKALIAPLSRARLKQGRLLGLLSLLDTGLSSETRAQILVDECLNTSAIEGERFDIDAIRSSVARHLGLPTAGLPAPIFSVSGPPGLVQAMQQTLVAAGVDEDDVRSEEFYGY